MSNQGVGELLITYTNPRRVEVFSTIETPLETPFNRIAVRLVAVAGEQLRVSTTLLLLGTALQPPLQIGGKIARSRGVHGVGPKFRLILKQASLRRSVVLPLMCLLDPCASAKRSITLSARLTRDLTSLQYLGTNIYQQLPFPGKDGS